MDSNFNEAAEDTDLEKTLHHLLTANSEQTKIEPSDVSETGNLSLHESDIQDDYSTVNEAKGNANSAAMNIFDPDIIQGKHLTLESILDGDDELFFALDDNAKKRTLNEDYEHNSIHKKRKGPGSTVYEQLLSPASLSPLSADDNANTNGNSLYKNNNSKSPSAQPEPHTNEFTMEQVKEMKKRIINTHKLMLNFNFLKDSYSKTCVEFKKVLNILKESEIHRSHLLKENEELKAQLTGQSNNLK